MLIYKCCKDCLNKNSGICNCTLPLYCNEFVEDDKHVDTNINYIDILHKESTELLINSFIEKDRQISELQKQHKEKDEVIKKLQKLNGEIIKLNSNVIKEKQSLEQEINQLKQQLQYQPVEIVEKINSEIYTRMVIKCEETKYTDMSLILYKILKEYQK